MVEKHNIHTICAHKKIHKIWWYSFVHKPAVTRFPLFYFPLPSSSSYSTHSLPFLFSLYLTRSVSHPEEIRNSDGSWVVTVTVLCDLCPSPALYPSLLLLFPRRCLAFPQSPSSCLRPPVSTTPAVTFPSSPGSCNTSFTFCMFCFLCSLYDY